MQHYLDYNATAPLRPEVVVLMQELQLQPLNPSSAHALGRRAKSLTEDARRVIAEIIGAFTNEVIFTASGTEANNTVLRAFADAPLVVSAIEHSSVLKTAQALSQPLMLPVTQEGVVDLAVVEKILPREGRFLVSVMLANNETGVTQPIRHIADIVHARGGLMHCDAVQAFGKIPVDFTALNCDLITLSAHKMGGPIGVAALVVRNGLDLPSLLTGGLQEMRRRAGTENVAAIAGFAKAAQLIDLSHMHKIREWLNRFEEDVSKQNIIGATAERLPNTSCISMPNISSETQLIRFDLEQIAVSAGSACSSGRIEPSHVLKAMGVPDERASTAIRVSSGWGTTEKDIMALSQTWKKLFELKNSTAS